MNFSRILLLFIIIAILFGIIRLINRPSVSGENLFGGYGRDGDDDIHWPDSIKNDNMANLNNYPSIKTGESDMARRIDDQFLDDFMSQISTSGSSGGMKANQRSKPNSHFRKGPKSNRQANQAQKRPLHQSTKISADQGYVGLCRGQIEACKANPDALSRLVRLTYKHIKWAEKGAQKSPADAARLILDAKSDEDYYAKIAENIVEPSQDNTGQLGQVWNKRFDMALNKLMGKTRRDFRPKSYLDIGCGAGDKTLNLGKMLGISPGNIHGADVPDWGHFESVRNKDLNFKYIGQDGVLPYQDGQFDFVSLFMVLHHVPVFGNKEGGGRTKFMEELTRICQKGAIIFAREHDAFRPHDYMLIDIEHAIYALSYPSRREDGFVDNYYADYFSARNMIRYFEDWGFKCLGTKYDYTHEGAQEISPTRYIYLLFKKI